MSNHFRYALIAVLAAFTLALALIPSNKLAPEEINQTKLERLLAEREGLYREFAAHVVDGSGPPGEVADAIVEELRWSA